MACPDTFPDGCGVLVHGNAARQAGRQSDIVQPCLSTAVPVCTHQHDGCVVQVSLHYLPPCQPCLVGGQADDHQPSVPQHKSRPIEPRKAQHMQRRAWVVPPEEGAVGAAEGPRVVVGGAAHHHTCGGWTRRRKRISCVPDGAAPLIIITHRAPAAPSPPARSPPATGAVVPTQRRTCMSVRIVKDECATTIQG